MHVLSLSPTFIGDGFRGNYLPNPDSLVSLLVPPTNQQNSTTVQRKKRQVSNTPTTDQPPQFNGINDPLVCLEIGQSLLFFISNSSYPVYDENNLLNMDADRDLGLFVQLVEDQLLAGRNELFVFRFTESGVFSFYLSNAVERYIFVRVVEPSARCPETGPFFPATPSRAVQLGIVLRDNIVQDPNWPLIGGLLGGGVAIMVSMVIALVGFYRTTFVHSMLLISWFQFFILDIFIPVISTPILSIHTAFVPAVWLV